ncbi:MAG: hypothetical protein ACFFEK_08870 [Candidatus Thorarchaeota archaeon]
MKLFYKVSPDNYRTCMDTIRERFAMHEEIDEARTILMLDDDSQIERVMGTFNPHSDTFAHVRVNLNDKSLKDFFDSVLGQPYKVKR